jgi:hypothetical protein
VTRVESTIHWGSNRGVVPRPPHAVGSSEGEITSFSLSFEVAFGVLAESLVRV